MEFTEASQQVVGVEGPLPYEIVVLGVYPQAA